MAMNATPIKLMTPEFRGSYVHAFKPRAASKTSEPKFSIRVVIPKEDPFWKEVDEATEKVAIEEWGRVPRKLKRTIHDGDDQDEDTEKEEFFGCFYFTATSDTKPGVIDLKTGKTIIDASEVYSGAYYMASVNVSTWEHEEGGKGVSIYLNNLAKVRDGEAFSGRASAAQDFAGYIDGDAGDENDDDDPTG